MRNSIAKCTAIFLGFLLAAGLAGCSKTQKAEEEIQLVRAQTVKIGATGQTTGYSGEVRGRYESELAFQVGGKIVKRNVDLGSIVRAGDVLMEIDSKDIEQTVNISLAQVASAESQLNLAETNVKRYRKLYAQGAISQALLDQYQNAYEVAQAAANQASAQYTKGVNQLGYSELTADSAGVVSGINAEVGQVVGAGQTILTLVKEGGLEIEINVPENRITEMRAAQQLSISFWALPDVTAAGQVREISPMADKTSKTYKTRISLINPPQGVNLGMTANVKVAASSANQALYIPLAAIYQTGDTPNVWVIKDGVVKLRQVKVGNFGDGTIQILDGLNDGDVIVIAGVQKLREGQKVRI